MDFFRDFLGDFLQDQGINDFMIELGGEVLCKGINQDGRSWRLAIDKPVDLMRNIPIEADEIEELMQK